MIVAPLKASLWFVYPCGVHTNYTRKHKKEGVENPLFLYGYFILKTNKSFMPWIPTKIEDGWVLGLEY